MDFINKNFPSALKLMVGLITIFIFIRIIPLLVAAAIMFWAVNKCIKRLRTYKEKRKSKVNRQEKVYEYSNVYRDKNYFDLSGRNIIDVEYEDVKS